MNIQNLVTELQKKQVCVLHKPNSNFAIVFDREKYIIEINANNMVCIKRIDNKCNVIKLNANCNFELAKSDYFGSEKPLFVNGKVNKTFFPDVENIKTFDISKLEGTSVDEQYAKLGNFKYSDALKSIITKILEIYKIL